MFLAWSSINRASLCAYFTFSFRQQMIAFCSASIPRWSQIQIRFPTGFAQCKLHADKIRTSATSWYVISCLHNRSPPGIQSNVDQNAIPTSFTRFQKRVSLFTIHRQPIQSNKLCRCLREICQHAVQINKDHRTTNLFLPDFNCHCVPRYRIITRSGNLTFELSHRATC